MNLELQKYQYRAEGNHNLVVALHGTNMVLRLQKAKVIENNSLSILQKFINTVMHPVLGDYVSKVCVVTLNNDQMEKIKKAIALERPKKFCLDNNLQSAGVLMKDQGVLPNTCSGPTLSIEIKPKLSILSSNFYPDLCNFCQKQEKNWEIKNFVKSKYCPFDLFSGDSARMTLALKHLMLNPQNNMMFFKDGILLDDIQRKSFLSSTFGDETIVPQVLVSLLTAEPNCEQINLKPDQNFQVDFQEKSRICNKKFESLPEKCILNTILSHQRINMRDDEVQSLLDTLQSVGLDEENFHEVLSKDKIIDSENVGIHKMIQDLRKIAISLTLRNSSLMITLAPEDRKDTNKDGSWIAIDDKLFRYKISLIDLDPKPLSKLQKFAKDRTRF